MEILRDYKQICDKVNRVFAIDVTNIPILDSMSYGEIKNLMQNARVSNELQPISTLAELVFQLNEYIPALCNFIKMFIYSKNYTGIIAFMEKLFVAHVGVANYNSKNKEYSHKERFFDRFVEVVKSTDLELKDYLPFLFAICEGNEKSPLSVWQEPCLEYMQNLFRENLDQIKAFVNDNPNYKNSYLALNLEFNTQMSIGEIFNLEEGVADEKLFSRMLKYYYTDTMAFFDKNLDNAGDKKLAYVKILASIENPEVTARLENLYEEETNEEIRLFLKSKLGIADKSNLGCSPKHFETMALKKVFKPQERTLGVPFEKMPLKYNDNSEAGNVAKTYLINIFKEEKDLLNLEGLSDVKKLFNYIDIQNFAFSLFNSLKRMQDIKEAKWAIRLIALVCDNELEDQVYDFISELYKAKRAKEAKYFVLCLIYSKKVKVINLLTKLAEDGEESFITDKDYFVSLYSEFMSKPVSDVQDMLVDDLITDEKIDAQKTRLYKNFIANKSYTKEQFIDIFVNKKIFNILAQKLVFGEYKQNRLVNLFILEDDKIKLIAGTPQENESEIKIKIAHSLDIDDRFEEFKNYFNEPTFKQFDNSVFAVKDNEKTLVKVSNMQGILVNSNKFIANMTKYGFIKNIANEGDDTQELIHICPELNLLGEVSFESPVNNFSVASTIGYIRFYKLNQCLKNGNLYIINKTNAIAVGGVEPRYYDYVVGSVSKSLRN